MHSFSFKKQPFINSHVTFPWLSKQVADSEQEEAAMARTGRAEGIAFKQLLESQLFRVHLSLLFLHGNHCWTNLRVGTSIYGKEQGTFSKGHSVKDRQDVITMWKAPQSSHSPPLFCTACSQPHTAGLCPFTRLQYPVLFSGSSVERDIFMAFLFF